MTITVTLSFMVTFKDICKASVSLLLIGIWGGGGNLIKKMTNVDEVLV